MGWLGTLAVYVLFSTCLILVLTCSIGNDGK